MTMRPLVISMAADPRTALNLGDLKMFTADLDDEGSADSVPVSARVGFGDSIKKISATIVRLCDNPMSITNADRATLVRGRSRRDQDELASWLDAYFPDDQPGIGPVASTQQMFGGHPRHVADARRYVRAVLGDHPARDAAVLAASELAANAIQHTASGRALGMFTVCLGHDEHRVTIMVLDEGGNGEPVVLSLQDRWAENGRGLALVTALASTCAVIGNGLGVVAVLHG
jgi:serine/threonine-protein kinase RsbW